ncbi:hypothetical protein JCM11251_005420 [Rhodosporidiobolus azoricus]
MGVLTPLVSRVGILLVLTLGVLPVLGHEHHEVETGPYEDNFTNEEPIDGILKAHIAIQVLCWGILFPAGMVLGITRSRAHVPLQSLTVVLSLCGNYLGHHHKGRSFHMTAHAHFAGYLWWYMITQTALGVFLKLHVLEGTLWRRGAVFVHGVVGKSFPIVGWTQMLMGGIAALGFCFGGHFGQCLAHFIMGSAFIAYAAILLLMLRVGAGWLVRRKVSQEYLDSWVIMIWGIINTFTEHNWLVPGQSPWNHKDLQHTSLGILWWAGGALGIFLGRNGKRNVLPAIIIAMTGYAMANHGQSLEFSTSIHQFFGFALMSAGAARVIEICFVLRDAPTPVVSSTTSIDPSTGTEVRHETGPSSFQHLTPFLLVLSGLTFLSATEEQMQWLAGSIMDSTTYSILIFSTAFTVYLWGVVLVDLYENQMRMKSAAQAVEVGAVEDVEAGEEGVLPARLRSDDPRRVKLWGIPIPAALIALVDFGRRLEARGRNGTLTDDEGGQGRGRGRGHLRRDTVDYGGESMPLTSRDSVGARQDAFGGQEEGEGESVEMLESRSRPGSDGSGRPGSDETVFEVGEFEDDDGGDAYWAEKEERGEVGRRRA